MVELELTSSIAFTEQISVSYLLIHTRQSPHSIVRSLLSSDIFREQYHNSNPEFKEKLPPLAR